jgi:hypothetical protein
MYISKFRFYSMGVAAENKKRSSMELEVVPVEILNMVDGELVPNLTDIDDKGIDGRGQEYSVKVTSANSIKAVWLQFGSNRTTAPDVRRGEPIFLFQYADSEVFYWVCPGLKDELRRLETVVHAYSNTTDESVRQLDATNSYYVEVSTHDKHMTVHTSKNDGEPFEYTIQINTAEGVVTITDDDGNFFQLDSSERRLLLQNKDNSFLDINKRNIFMSAPKHIGLKCETYSLDASKSSTMTTQVWSANASNSIAFNSPQLTATIGSSTFIGAVNVSGPTQLAGGLAFVPALGVAPTMTASASGMEFGPLSGGIIMTDVSIVIDAIDIGPTHKHRGNLSAPTSPVLP